MAPPALIQATRGPMPAKNGRTPCAAQISRSTTSTRARSRDSITRVLSTSSGVVTAAATAPLKLPYRALSAAPTVVVVVFVLVLLFVFFPAPFVPPLDIVISSRIRLFLLSTPHALRASHSGNWITVKGTSRMTVMPQPR